MSGLLIKNGTVVNDDSMVKADVLIQGGLIVDVQPTISVNDPEVRVIDATDKLIIPGGIDPHTHLQLPYRGDVSVDDFYTGTRAALAGGTTMIIDFASKPRGTLPIDNWRQWREWADHNVCCDYGLTVAITSWSDEIAAQMEELTKPEYGINSFKFYMAYTEYMVRDEEFYEGLKQCVKIGALARVHAEHGPFIDAKQKELLEAGVTGPEGHPQAHPEELEAEATNRACTLAAQAKCPLYVVHVMSKNAARAVAYHRQKGHTVFGEAISAALALDGRGYFEEDWTKAAAMVMSPPLSRDPTTPKVLMDLLACGQLHLTGTDNCSWTCAQKKQGLNDFTKIPSGLNGLEDRMSLIWENGVHKGKLDPMRFVAITSSAAAKIFNCYPKKGKIARGSDADLVIWDPQKTRVISASKHHHGCDYNVFEGMTVHGVAEVTICKGVVVWENGELNVERGFGKYVPLMPFCDHVFGTLTYKKKE
uniref:dihydropyrimidinase n=1 Tax=Steinernema glaseri TaxID=37863 RepID=A0A1I8AQH8_9BILA